MKKKAYTRVDGSQSYKGEVSINGVRITKRFSRLADLDRWTQDKKREKELVESGLCAPSNLLEIKLSDFSETWLAKRKQQGKPEGSWLADSERLKKWVKPSFGERVLQKISTLEFENFLDKLVSIAKLSPSTRNRVRSLLHKMYNDAKRQGLLQINPISNVMVWKENQEGFDYWHSLEECQAYLTHAELEASSFYVYCVLALNTGARIGELIALQNSDIDLSNRRIHLCKLKEYRSGKICKRTKGGGDRWLGMNEEVYKILLSHKQNTNFSKPSDFVIFQESGDSINARTVRAIHKRVCKRAGIREIRIHDLRHTFASHFVMNGGSINDLQGMLGHSSPMMTQRYAHLAPGYLESKAAVVQIGKFSSNIRALKVV